VTLVEFGDFECPYCGEEEPVLKQLGSAYASDLRLVFKEFPLSIHPDAERAAEAALAANAQGKFWPYHDTLYANQDALTESDLVSYATDLALDVSTFQTAIAQGTYEPAVQADVAQGESLGVAGTPTFFVNGRVAVGALPYATLAAAVDQELDAGD
jgi:protein-disulfide isomerase